MKRILVVVVLVIAFLDLWRCAMSDFDEDFAVNVAFPQSVVAYTAAGFGDTCADKQPKDFGTPSVIEVDSGTCKEVWHDPTVSPRAKRMLETVMADPHNFGFV